MVQNITIKRGDSFKTKLNIKDSDINIGGNDSGLLPSVFQAIFTVKKILDEDTADSQAAIQKFYNFPADFELSNGYYKADISLSKADTLISEGSYFWNIRFIDSPAEEVSSTNNGSFDIELGTTQRQTQFD